jgi:hypothetical protein
VCGGERAPDHGEARIVAIDAGGHIPERLADPRGGDRELEPGTGVSGCVPANCH